jgi:hypothetical protein
MVTVAQIPTVHDETTATVTAEADRADIAIGRLRVADPDRVLRVIATAAHAGRFRGR